MDVLSDRHRYGGVRPGHLLPGGSLVDTNVGEVDAERRLGRAAKSTVQRSTLAIAFQDACPHRAASNGAKDAGRGVGHDH